MLIALALLPVAVLAAVPAAAQEPPAPAVAAAHSRIEALEREVALLTALREAQAKLIAWAAESDTSPPARLPPALCVEQDLKAWCAALPHTFGREGSP